MKGTTPSLLQRITRSSKRLLGLFRRRRDSLPKKYAEQIAHLLNTRNRLDTRYDAATVERNAENILYILEGDTVVACVEVVPVQWYQCEVRHLSVRADCEGKGYANRLLRMAEERMRQHGALLAQCTIRSDNRASKHLFAKLGYRHVTTVFNPSTGNTLEVWQKAILPPPAE